MNALIRNWLNCVQFGQAIPEQRQTAREEEALKLVAEGHSSEEIADTLFISIKTVERHRANMLRKLVLRDRLELARYAIRAGTYSPRVRDGIVGMVRTWRREVSRLREPWRRGGFDDRHGSGGTT